MILIDGHLDLAMNALLLNRDLTLSVFEIRKQEIGMPEKGKGTGTVAFPEMHKGKVGVCMATILPRMVKDGVWSGYSSPAMSCAAGRGQLAYYQILEKQGFIRIIKTSETLNAHIQEWQESQQEHVPLGFVLSMEGADAILDPENLVSWWKDGLRVVSLVHYGVNTYAHGTGASGGLTLEGLKLLETLESLGAVLDVTHLSDESFWEALDNFDGSILASHNNCRDLVPGDRQFSDEQIRALTRREAVIGVAFDAWMLYPGWIKGKTPNTVVTMEAVADQLDHIRRLAENSRNVGIGSDLDGGFGKEQCPHDLDTIADLQKIPRILKSRTYSDNDVENVMWRNWVRLFRRAWS